MPMIEAFSIGTSITIQGNAQSQLTKLIEGFEKLSRAVKQTEDAVGILGRGLRGLNDANKGINQLTRSLERLGNRGLGGGAVGDVERMANATKDMVVSSERLSRIMAENAKLAADTARAMQSASKATTGGVAAGAVAGGRAGRHKEFGGHDWMMTGMAAEMAGGPLIHAAHKAFEGGMEVEQLRSVLLSDTRVSKAQAEDAVQAALKATRTAPGTVLSQNLDAVVDLKNVLGSLQEAQDVLPGFSKLTSILQVSDRKRGGKGDQAFAAAKAMDLLGELIEERTDSTGHVTREISPERVNRYLGLIARVNVATHGRVAPEDYLRFAKMGEVAGMQMTDEFLYEKLPAMMLAMPAARVGTAFQSINQVFSGNRLTPKSYEALEKFGLAGAGGLRYERDPLTHKKRMTVDAKAGVYDLDLLAKDPLAFMEHSQRRMEDAGVHGTDAQIKALQEVSQRSTIARILVLLLKDMPGILREQQNIKNTDVNTMTTSPQAHLNALTSALTNFWQVVGQKSLGDAITVMDKLTFGLNKLSDWVQAHPDDARFYVDVAVGLGAVAMALGTLSTAIFVFGPALRLLTSIGRAAPAITAAAEAGTAIVGLTGEITALSAALVAAKSAAGPLAVFIATMWPKPANASENKEKAEALEAYKKTGLKDEAYGALFTAPQTSVEPGKGLAYLENKVRFRNWWEQNTSSLLGTKTSGGDIFTGGGMGATSADGMGFIPPAPLVRTGAGGIHDRIQNLWENGGLGSAVNPPLASGQWSPLSEPRLMEMGTTIGQKSADAVKDKLDPHVIGSEIGNIAAATIRAAISSLQINVDGQQFGRVVDRHADQQALRPPTGPALPNVNLGPMFPAHAS